MTKKNTPESVLKPKSRLSIGSSGKKSALAELRTSKGTSSFDDAIISAMFGVSLALGSISRAQEVLLDRIESIAAKMETLQKEVKSLQTDQQNEAAMKSQNNLPMISNEEIQEWLNSPIPSPERGIIPDITCYEIPFHYADPSYVIPSVSDGYVDLPEWANHV